MSADEPVLLLVAIRTDQPDIKRRLDLILSAARPTTEPPDTMAQVWARPLSDLRAHDWDRLRVYFGWDGMEALNIGSVVGLERPKPQPCQGRGS